MRSNRGLFAAVALLGAGLPLQADPCSGAESQFSAAHAAIQRRDAPAAEQILSAIQRSHPQCAQAKFELGMLFDRLQQPGKAAEQFEQVVKLTPENPQAFDYLALSLEPLGRFERAEWAYKKGLGGKSRY